jgi:methionyl-tRNA formyltransferase
MAEGRRIVFAGTPTFAAVVLAHLLQRGEELVGVLTQPDRPAGRGRKLQASPVKVLASEAGLPILQPESSRAPETLDWLRQLAPDLLIVVAFGQILPQAMLDLPRLGAINVHASLLPAWRGAAAIARAIAAGDAETGICIMQMEAGLDSGPVLWTRTTPILDTDTAATLHDRLAELGAEALGEALDRLWVGGLQAVPQDASQVSYAKKLRKEEARIDWAQSASVLDRQIRAFHPYPVAHTEFRGQPLRIWSASRGVGVGSPGTVIALRAEGPEIACGEGSLVLTRVQPAGKAQLSGADFVRGYRPLPGEVLA